MSDIDNILGNSDKEKNIDSQKLMDYLSGKLSDEEQHEMERLMEDSELGNDALEGLQGVENKAGLELVTYDLNHRLKQQLQLKNTNLRNKRKITNFNLTVIAIVIILLLCVLGYVVIKMYNK